MEHASSKSLRIGVNGWTWSAWDEAFYPDGLPSEWRLTYFNTQFQCVYLVADEWCQRSEIEWAAWAEDTHEGFLFLLEGDSDTPVPAPLRGRALVLPQDDPHILWLDARTDLKALAQTLQAASGLRYLLSRDGDLGQLERVRTLLGLLGFAA